VFFDECVLVEHRAVALDVGGLKERTLYNLGTACAGRLFDESLIASACLVKSAICANNVPSVSTDVKLMSLFIIRFLFSGSALQQLLGQ
jgi:hypothetical protein